MSGVKTIHAIGVVLVLMLAYASSHAWWVVTDGLPNQVMMEDFESGVLHVRDANPYPDGFGWHPTSNGGVYTWALDPNNGADGSSKSLKFTMQEGSPYFWYMHEDRDMELLHDYDKPINRMRFFVNLPQGWMIDRYNLVTNEIGRAHV